MRKILVVIDMQNDFISGSLGSEDAKKIVPKVLEKIKGYPIENVYATRDTHHDDYLNTQEGHRLPIIHCIEDSVGWEINEQLKPFILEKNIVNKPTFGSVKLAEVLKKEYEKTDLEIEIIGLCTDICVVSNALLLKANMPEVRIMVDPICCAGITRLKHEAALETMRSCQIDIL